VETQASFIGPIAKGDSKEGLNRRGARNLMHGGGFGGNTGQSNEDSAVRNTG